MARAIRSYRIQKWRGRLIRQFRGQGGSAFGDLVIRDFRQVLIVDEKSEM